MTDPLPIFDLPPGAKDSDPRWQKGYEDGDQISPRSDDPVYVSGWCHGHNEGAQCSGEESVAAYRLSRAFDRTPADVMDTLLKPLKLPA